LRSSKSSKDIGERPILSKNYFSLLGKGFAVNALNPFPLVFWCGVMTSFYSQLDGRMDFFLLFGSIFLTVILTDVLKILLAKQLKGITNLIQQYKTLAKMSRVSPFFQATKQQSKGDKWKLTSPVVVVVCSMPGEFWRIFHLHHNCQGISTFSFITV